MAAERRSRREESASERLNYKLDRFLHLHPVIQLAFVLAATLMMAVVFGTIVSLIGGNDVSDVSDGLWWAVTRMLDGGTIADERGPIRRIFGLGVSLAGLTSLAVLTGAFASSFADRVRVLRQGRIPIFERDHIVLLGWNALGAVVLRELAASGMRATVVVLADQDRDLLEERAKEALEGMRHRIRIVVKRGDPTTTTAIRSVAARAASVVAILPDMEEAPITEADVAPSSGEGSAPRAPDDPEAVLLPRRRNGHRGDRSAMRSLLAVRRVLRGRRVPMVVEVSCKAGEEMLRLCAGDDGVVVVDARDVNAQVLVHAVQQPGTFDVVRQILSLKSSSIHLHPAGPLAGRTFDEAHATAAGGVLIGLLHGRELELSPDGGRVIARADKIVFLSDDESAPRVGGTLPCLDEAALPGPASAMVPPRSLHVLVTRHKPELASILECLGEVHAARVTILVPPEEVPAVRRAIGSSGPGSRGFEVLSCDPLDAGAVSRALALRPDVALLLAPDVPASQLADADSDQIITLIHLRRPSRSDPSAGEDTTPVHAVVELRSPETRRLVAVDHNVDFVLSGEIVGMLLAQEIHALHEDRAGGAALGKTYRSILDAVSTSVRLCPLSEYAAGEERPAFGHIAATARARGEVAIGVAQTGAAALLLPDRAARFERDGTHVVVLRAAARAADTDRKQAPELRPVARPDAA